MLFMGGIFTSCIPQNEPEGVREMRLAHARYLDKLGELVEANKAVAAADAAFIQAKAAVKQAAAREKTADAVAKEIANAIAQADADQQIANILDQMEQDRLNNQAALLAAQAALAQAQKDLEDALAAIEIEKLAMSDEEAAALAAIKANYDQAAADLKAWYEAYKTDQEDMYFILYSYLLTQGMGAGGYVDEYFADYPYQTVEEWLYDHYGIDLWIAANQEDYIAEQIKLYEFDLANKRAEAEFWKGLLEDMDFDYLAEAQALEDEAKAMAPEFADVLRDSTLFENEYGTARDRAINAANKAYDDAIGAPKEAYDKAIEALKGANKNWKNQVNELAEADIDNPAKKWTAKKGEFKFKKGYALPDHSAMAPDLVEAYKTQLGFNGFAGNVTFKNDSLFVEIAAQKDSAAYATVVDTIWNGNQSTQELLKQKTGLWSVYEDFTRDLLFDINKKGLEADAEAIKAYSDKLHHEYDSILNILKSAKDGQGAALVDAWAKKVAAAGKSVSDLAKKIDAYQDYDKKAENNIYTFSDNVNGYDGPAPVIVYHYAAEGRLISQATDDATHFILNPAASPWFDSAIGQYLTIAPTKTDSTNVFNAIKDYFKAIASINEKSVPYLKFIAGEGVGTFKVDSVRADKIEFAGLQMKKTNTYLDGLGIHRAAAYDNKGINALDAAPAVGNYVDAYTNLIQLFNHYVHGDALTLPFYTASDAAYSAGTSGVAAYAAYVTDFKANNTGATLDKFKKVFGTYTADDFKKYTQMSDEGKAVANWMDANEKYFGIEGLAGFGENVYFTYETFTEPTWVVVFDGLPTYTKDDKGKVNSVTPAALVSPKTYQYSFVEKAIMDNLGANSVYATASMPTSSLVFKLLAIDYLYNCATNADSINAIWDKLGELLKQVKADMDAVDAAADKTTAANNALAAKFNEALDAYRAATKDLKETRDAAIKEANEAYDAAKKEILDPISAKYVELRNKYNDLMNLADGLRDAYTIYWAGGVPDVDDLLEYLNTKYEDALEAADWDEYYIAELKVLAGLITIEDPTLDEIQATIDLIDEILAEMDWDEYYDLEFWYEYWKAAYEAAVARFAE